MLEWSGERYLPWIADGSIHYEHLHRYRLAAEMARGKRVLDLGSGEGYGAAMIAEEAAAVVGIDNDDAAVRHAQKRYGGPRLTFLRGSLVSVPLSTEHPFDLVVCFEALEHVVEHRTLIQEVDRLLKRQHGVFLVSTPNRLVYTDRAAHEPNPYHVKELYLEELHALLREVFDHVLVWGQQVYPVSQVFPLETAPPASSPYRPFALRREPARYQPSPLEAREARYFLALASREPTSPCFGESTLFDLSRRLLCEAEDPAPAAAELKIVQLEERLAHRRSEVDSLRNELARQKQTERGFRANLRSRELVLSAVEGKLREAELRLRSSEQLLGAILRSRSWKLTAPLRFAAETLRRRLGRPRSIPSRTGTSFPGNGTPAAPAPTASRAPLVVSVTKKNLLVVDHDVLHPDRDAGSLRLSRMIEIFQQLGYQVNFYAARRYCAEPYAEAMRARGIRTAWMEVLPSLEEHLRQCGYLYDVAVLSRVAVANQYLRAIRRNCPQCFLIFDTVDLHHLREERHGQIENDARILRLARQTKREELEVVGKADVTVVASRAEERILNTEVPDARVAVVPTLYELNACEVSFEDRRDLLFIGSYYHRPNVDAVVHFVRKTLPRIKEHLPDVRFHALGSDPPPELLELASEDILVPGQIEDVSPWFRSCRVFVCPLRYGAGVKGKICHSLSFGLPVVATPLSVEGMELEQEKDFLMASEPLEFARAVSRLYSDKKLWQRLSAAGRTAVEERFSPRAARRSLESLLEFARSRTTVSATESANEGHGVLAREC